MIYFVAYDIADRKRRTKVRETLANFGVRVQYSFFECDMDKKRMEELKAQLLSIMEEAEDSLRVYPLCEDCLKKVSLIGTGDVFVPKTFEIL